MATDATQIVLLQLRQYGVDLDTSLTFGGFTPDVLYSVCRRGLELLPGVFEEDAVAALPASMPGAASSRFNLCGKVIVLLQAAGLSLEFNALMYPTEESARTVVAWFVARLAAAAEERSKQAMAAVDGTGATSGGERLGSGTAAGSAVLTSFARSMLGLRAAVRDAEAQGAVASVGKRGKERAALPDAFLRPSRHRAAATTRHRVPTALRTAPGVAAEALEGAVGAIFSAHTALSKQPPVDDPLYPRPPLAAFLRDTALHLTAALRACDPSFSECCGHPLSSGEADAALLAAAAASRRSVAIGAQASAGAGRGEGAVTGTGRGGLSALEVDSMFMNSDNAVTVQELKRAEEDAEEAVRALETDRATAEGRLHAREEEAERVRAEVKAAKKLVAAQKARLADLQQQMSQLEQEGEQRAETAAAELATIEEALAALEVREQRLALMDDPEGAAETLREELEALQERRATLQSEAAAKLAKVEAKRESLVEAAASSGSGREEEVSHLRQEIKKVKRSIKTRQSEIAKLLVQLDACPKEIDRNSFLRLIFDLTANIRKQQEQIDRTRRDVALADEEITTLQGGIKGLLDVIEERAFPSSSAGGGKAGAEEKGKKPPKRDEALEAFGKDAYRRFHELRTAYSNLIAVIEDRGLVRKEIHETEQHASKLHLIVSHYNVGGVEADLRAISTENETLQSAVDAAGS